jgi:large subunit ribosomal protein L21
MDGEEGDTISLDRVLMIGGESVKLGAPTIAGATVEARIRTHEKGDKVITFKYLHRRRFRRKVGFRHSHTTLEIVAIHG